MKRSFGILICFVLAGANLAFGAWGTKGTSGAKFLQLGVNARAIGMGEAYSAVADGSDAVYWNPAGLGKVQKQAASFMHAVYLENIFYDFASYAYRFGRLATVGVGVQYLSAGTIDRADEFGARQGTFEPHDFAATLSVARQFTSDDDLTLGLSGKFIQSRIVEEAVTGAADVGLLWKPADQWDIACGVQNLGGNLKYKSESDGLPLNVKLGTMYGIKQGWIAAADVNFPRDNDPFVSIGSEYKVRMMGEAWMAGRLGYNSRSSSDLSGISSVNAGAGFGWGAYSVDMSWSPYGQLGSAYRFSLSAKF